MNNALAIAGIVIIGGTLLFTTIPTPLDFFGDYYYTPYAWTGVTVGLQAQVQCPLPGCNWTPPQVSPTSFSGVTDANGVLVFIVNSFQDGIGTSSNSCGSGQPVEWPPIFSITLNGQQYGASYPQFVLNAGTQSACGSTTRLAYSGPYWYFIVWNTPNGGVGPSCTARSTCYVIQLEVCIASLGSCSSLPTPPPVTYNAPPSPPPAYVYNPGNTFVTTVNQGTTTTYIQSTTATVIQGTTTYLQGTTTTIVSSTFATATSSAAVIPPIVPPSSTPTNPNAPLMGYLRILALSTGGIVLVAAFMIHGKKGGGRK